MSYIGLDASDLADIRDRWAELGAKGLAEWIGCSDTTVRQHARRMGLTDHGNVGKRSQARIARDQPGEAKVCCGCDRLLLLAGFHASPQGRMGRRSRCKLCERAYDRQRMRKRPPRFVQALAPPDPPELPLKVRHAVQNCVRFPSMAELEHKLEQP